MVDVTGATDLLSAHFIRFTLNTLLALISSSIPVHPSLTDADVTRVVEAVNTAVAEAAA